MGLSAYATASQLEEFVSTSVWEQVDDADRLLKRASELIDEIVRAPYDVDSDGLPTDTDTADTLRDATCAQVEQWVETGEENDVDGLAGTDISVTGYSGRRPTRWAPRAIRILRNQGLIGTSTQADMAHQFFATQTGT